MKQKAIKVKSPSKELKPIDVQVGSTELRGKVIPIVDQISVEQQRDWLNNGGTLSELVDYWQVNYYQ